MQRRCASAAKVLGQFDNCYESEIEIDRLECETIDSDCDCPYNYDCQHLAALLFYLEEHIDKILVAYSKENDLKQIGGEIGRSTRKKRKSYLKRLKRQRRKRFRGKKSSIRSSCSKNM